MSSTSILNISQKAMENSRAAIATTAENISNVNTEGYKRRRIDFSGYTNSVGMIGINLQYGDLSVTRMSEQFIDNKIFQESHSLGKYETDYLVYSQIEDIFGESNDSALNNTINEFWSSWNDLAIDPENQSLRTILVNKGENLSHTFNRIHSDLRSLQNQISMDIEGKVNEINAVTSKIHDINGLLRNIRVGSNNDMLDERDMLLERLSKMIDVDMEYDTTGAVHIFSGGQIMVGTNYINPLVYESGVEDGFVTSEVSYRSGSLSPRIFSGELGSLLELHSDTVPGYVDKLDKIAINITNEVNNIHRDGYNLEGIGGLDFFHSGISSAGNFRVDRTIELNNNLVAASMDENSTGDGSLARKIADLKFDTFMDGTTLANYYSGMISEMGNQVQETEFLLSSQEKVMVNLKNQQDSISGVSNDEEMTNLIKYQQAYQAAARLVTTSQEMVSILMNMI